MKFTLAFLLFAAFVAVAIADKHEKSGHSKPAEASRPTEAPGAKKPSEAQGQKGKSEGKGQGGKGEGRGKHGRQNTDAPTTTSA
ncbi:hypothetical protein PVAND_015735 [Polypedilum vanderplanki]|uniref:Uncharacterized protein n=1 Tax=Polypedilum vanderplanki TaxID=319348 RepID=A0A9J6BDE7_POLVA|nr:hypothetical protein PVAND_015735 [Polypedilum vanderplanki]